MVKRKKKAESNRPDDVETAERTNRLIAELKDHVFQGRILEARTAALELNAMKNSVANDATKINSVEQIIDEVLDQADHVGNLLHDLHSDDGWTLAKESRGVTVHYRREAGTSIHTVRAQTLFRNFEPKDFTKLCSLFVETEYMPEWFPGGVMKSADVLSWHSKYSKVVQLHISLNFLPFLSPRDSIVFGNGYHLPDQNAFLIRSKSTQADTCRYCDIPKPAKGVVRMDTESIFFVQLLERDVISFKMIGRDDLRLKYVPSPLLNRISQGVLPYELMRTVKHTIRNFEGSLWDIKMKERGAYYKEIENKVNHQWDKVKRVALERPNYGSNTCKKAETSPASSTPVLLVMITVSLCFTCCSTQINEIFASKNLMMLLESERFHHYISSFLSLLLALASIRKVTKLSSEEALSS